MPRLQSDNRAPGRPSASQRPLTHYRVVRQEDVWFIKFEGEEYGPYQSEREALLFAIEAANKLGEQGDRTQVLVMDENGAMQPYWTYGRDPFPPKL